MQPAKVFENDPVAKERMEAAMRELKEKYKRGESLGSISDEGSEEGEVPYESDDE